MLMYFLNTAMCVYVLFTVFCLVYVGVHAGLTVNTSMGVTCVFKFVDCHDQQTFKLCSCFFRNSVRLVIRKVQYAPEKPGPQPMVETTRSFLMSDRSLHLEASLDKEVYKYTHTLVHQLSLVNSVFQDG